MGALCLGLFCSSHGPQLPRREDLSRDQKHFSQMLISREELVQVGGHVGLSVRGE